MWCEGTLPRHRSNESRTARSLPVTCHACDLCAYRRVGRSTVFTLQRLAYTAEVVVRERCVGCLRTRAERCHTAAACSGGGCLATSRWVSQLRRQPVGRQSWGCATSRRTSSRTWHPRLRCTSWPVWRPAAAPCGSSFTTTPPCGRTSIDAAGQGCGLSGLCVGDTTTNPPWTGGTHSAGAPKPPSK